MLPAINSGTRIKSRVTKAGRKKLQNEVKVGKLYTELCDFGVPKRAFWPSMEILGCTCHHGSFWGAHLNLPVATPLILGRTQQDLGCIISEPFFRSDSPHSSVTVTIVVLNQFKLCQNYVYTCVYCYTSVFTFYYWSSNFQAEQKISSEPD